MSVRSISRATVALVGVVLSGHLAAAQPVFNGDPVDPATGKAYMMLPGVPLVYPGADGTFHLPLINPAVVGDIDMVLRTGGTFILGTIPPPAAGLAVAPVIIAGGRHGNSGTEVPISLIVAAGTTSPPAVTPLLGPDLDYRRGLITAYADLDGDGFIGPTATSRPADIQIQRQEAFTFAGRTMVEIHGGVASGQIAVSMGAPASAGGLGIVVGGGAVAGPTPPLYADGPWIATLLPYMIPLNQAQIVGGEPATPVDPIGLVDLELSQSDLYLPDPKHPKLGTPYAIPLDGSSVSVDLLRSNSGAAVGVGFARPIHRSTFVAQWGRVIRPAVKGPGQRDLVEDVSALSLPADGPGNAQALVVYPADLLGNPTDPPPGGFTITLDVGPGLRIVAPDNNGDPRTETIVFNSPSYVTVTIDDVGAPLSSSAGDRLLALHDGIPSGAVTFTITPGPGGVGVMQPPTAFLRHAAAAGRDRLGARAAFTSSNINPGAETVTITLGSPNGTFYQRVFPPGSFVRCKNGRDVVFRDPTARVVIRQSVRNPESHVLDVEATKVDLSAAPPHLGTLSLSVEIGTASYHSTVPCLANAAGTVTRCPG